MYIYVYMCVFMYLHCVRAHPVVRLIVSLSPRACFLFLILPLSLFTPSLSPNLSFFPFHYMTQAYVIGSCMSMTKLVHSRVSVCDSEREKENVVAREMEKEILCVSERDVSHMNLHVKHMNESCHTDHGLSGVLSRI